MIPLCFQVVTLESTPDTVPDATEAWLQEILFCRAQPNRQRAVHVD